MTTSRRAEDVDDPLEACEQRRAQPDEQAAHHQRAEDPPEQHPVLVLRRHGEVLEDQHDDEDVVDAERFLDQVAGEERQRGVMALEYEEPSGEQQGETDPDGGPQAGFARTDDVRSPVEDAEVEGEHRQDEGDETDPEPDVGGDHRESGEPEIRRASHYGTRGVVVVSPKAHPRPSADRKRSRAPS